MDRRVIDPRSVARIGALACAFAGVIAALVAVACATEARRWLGFGFAGVAPRIGAASGIFVDNARLALGAGAAAWVAQLRSRTGKTGSRASAQPALRLMAPAVDALVLTTVVVNTGLVGVAVGAYGRRTLVALLPHGPFEVWAYCIAANLYLTARRRPIAGREWLTAAVAVVSLLAFAAVLETFAWFGS
jgi:hypothetical protein